MAAPHNIIIEIYAVMFAVNIMVAVGADIYGEGTGGSIRQLLGQDEISNLEENVEQIGIGNLTQNIRGDDEGDWVSNAIQSMSQTFNTILYFVDFLLAGHITTLLTSLGFPGEFLILINVIMGFYTAYMILVLVTNRLYT